jgi:hypothetical protein
VAGRAGKRARQPARRAGMVPGRQEQGARRNSVSSAEAGLHLVGDLSRFWRARGHLSEGRERCAAALSRPGAQERTGARAVALRGRQSGRVAGRLCCCPFFS